MFIEEKERLIKEIENLQSKLSTPYSLDKEQRNIYSLLNELDKFNLTHDKELSGLNMNPANISCNISECIRCIVAEDLHLGYRFNIIVKCLNNIKSILNKENKNMLTKEKYEELYKLLANGNEEESNEELFNSLIANKEINSEQYKEIKELIGNEVRTQKIRPYQVFGDKEILTLLYNRPKTIQQLEGLKGFPKDGARVTKYGDKIVNIFNEEFNSKADSSFFNF